LVATRLLFFPDLEEVLRTIKHGHPPSHLHRLQTLSTPVRRLPRTLRDDLPRPFPIAPSPPQPAFTLLSTRKQRRPVAATVRRLAVVLGVRASRRQPLGYLARRNKFARHHVVPRRPFRRGAIAAFRCGARHSAAELYHRRQQGHAQCSRSVRSLRPLPPGPAVADTVAATWCTGEQNTCATLCANNPKANDCDPATLAFNCLCQNNSAPGLQYYLQSMPTVRGSATTPGPHPAC